MPINNDIAIVTKGIEVGERVVVNGQYRLDVGSRVDAKTQQQTQQQAAGSADKS
jgi:hypothetical protein